MSTSNRLGELSTGTMAEFVYLTAAHRAKFLKRKEDILGNVKIYENNTRIYQDIAHKLPSTKRIAYDDTVLGLIDKTEHLEAGQIVAQLHHTTFLFDEMWVEGPSPFHDDQRMAAFVTADQNSHSFTFRYVLELRDLPTHAYNRTGGRDLQYIENGRILDTRAVSIKVSPDGISFEDDKLLGIMEDVSQIYRDLGKNVEAEKLVSEAYSVADHLARLFVVLKSTKVATNYNEHKTKEDLALDTKNKSRMQLKRPPLLKAFPIRVDLTRCAPEIQSDSPVGEHEWFGKIVIGRSKYITRPDGTLWLRKRDGQPWFRKKHERKTINAADRSDAPRVLTVSNFGVSVKTFPDRPAQIHPSRQNDEAPN